MRGSLFSLAVAALLVSCLYLRAELPAREPLRDWKTLEGEGFRAAIVSFDGTTIRFRADNGRRSSFPLARLSPDDQSFLAEWLENQPLVFVMPATVGVETSEIDSEVVSEDERKEEFVYRTQNFEFISQGKFTQSLLREVARNFEATHALLQALPWEIDPKPPSGDRFRAKLFRSATEYEAAGGLKNSGGVYMGSREIFMVPFRSIGLKKVGKSYAKDRDFETHTLVHELTHQMMHFWLGYLPQWVIEGTAEYTALLPLRLGKFRVSAAKGGLRDYLDRLKRGSGVPGRYPLKDLFSMTNAEWNHILEQDQRMASQLYFTSYLLVYYFMHLDGDGDGQLFMRYFRKVNVVRQEVMTYAREVEEFKKQPGVVVAADGSYRWQGELSHPKKPAVLASAEARDAFQKDSLKILLNGRTESELMDEIQTAYAKFGLRF
jgi:hypothetical protein